LFNHESPRRGETFVSRKISRAVAAIKHGLQHELFLGNLDAKRDWGYAPEYVEGMWRIFQHGEGDDFVLATGENHTVREFVQTAFSHVDLDWKEFVRHDARYERPAEVDLLMGDASKAKKILNWEPKVRFHELVRIMVNADMELLSRETSVRCRELWPRSPTAVRRQRRGSKRRYLNPGQKSLHYHRRIGRFDADSVILCGERDCAHHANGPALPRPFDRSDTLTFSLAWPTAMK
jgi:hypothetical protein